MFQKNQTQKIIIFFSVLFLSGSIYLFAIDSRYNDPAYNKNWYALSFVDPKSDSLDFSIENFSSKKDFHWEVFKEKELVSSGDEKIQTGEKEKIAVPDVSIEPEQKYLIRVTSEKDIREIYKNIK